MAGHRTIVKKKDKMKFDKSGKKIVVRSSHNLGPKKKTNKKKKQ